MKDFIRKRLHEHWGRGTGGFASTEDPLGMELDILAGKEMSAREYQMALQQIEDKYQSKYAEYEGDSYGVIDAIKRFIPYKLAPLYDDMHPEVRLENVNEGGEPVLKFNKDGRFNKEGANTIYMDENPIVDFGVGGIGTIKINGQEIPNALYLKGGYNAAEQGKGYGSLGLKFIFQKLPKIMNIVIQCYDTACPFWKKMGGEEIAAKEMGGGHMLRTLRISRDSFE